MTDDTHRTEKAHGLRPRRRTAPGAPPGTLVADPAAPKSRISLITYSPSHFDEAEIDDVETLIERVAINRADKGTVTWIDVTGLGDVAIITRLGETFDLHRLALEDVLHVHQRPKVEEYNDQIFIVFRMMVPGDHRSSEQVSLFLGEGFVLTFQERPGDSFDSVRNRLRQRRGVIRTMGADYLAYALIDATIDHYFPVLEAYDDRLDHLTELALNRPDSSVVGDLHKTKRELFNLRRIIWASREMLNTLMRADNTIIKSPTMPYLRDCYDHCVQLMDILEMQREVAASLFDIYLSSLSNRLNETMKMLTLVATIFIPLGFIASLYGMNFDRASPWNMPELGWKYGYPFALGLMTATAVGLFIWFKKRRWLGDGGQPKKNLRRAPHPKP